MSIIDVDFGRCDAPKPIPLPSALLPATRELAKKARDFVERHIALGDRAGRARQPVGGVTIEVYHPSGRRAMELQL